MNKQAKPKGKNNPLSIGLLGHWIIPEC